MEGKKTEATADGDARARLRTLAREEEAGAAVGVTTACPRARATVAGGEQKAPSSPPLVDAPEPEPPL